MLGSRPIPFLKKLLKEHGDVVRFDVGPQPTVLIGNFDILRDLFKREVSSSKKKETPSFSAILWFFQSFSNRPHNPGWADAHNYDPEGRVCGIGFTEGAVNAETRQYFQRFMNKLGMTKVLFFIEFK